MASTRIGTRGRRDLRAMHDDTTLNERAQRDQRNHLLIGQALRWYRTEAAELTVTDRLYVWRHAAAWLEDHYQSTIDAATSEQLQTWRGDQACSRRTLATRISGLHVFYYWLVEVAEIRADDPSRKVKRPRRVKRDGRGDVINKAMSEKDFVLALEAALHDPELVAALMLGRYCGLRRIEITRLRGADLEPRPNGGAWASVLGKGSQWRRVPVPPAVWAAVRPLVTGRGLVFERHSRAKEINRAKIIGDKVSHHLKALGIQHVLHDTRHACATEALGQGANIREIQELLGHSSLETTALYTHVQPTRLAEVVDLVTRQSLTTHAPDLAHREPDQGRAS